MGLRVGIDMVCVADVSRAVAEHGDAYLERVYTPGELDAAQTADGIDHQRLAARFAAKEAALKVLRPSDDAVPWRSIETLRHPDGWVETRLLGRAAELAERAGITDLATSLTHENEYAVAVVVATIGGPHGREE